MKRKTILIIPPRGTHLKAFRIRLSIAIFFVVFIVVGLTGLFLPYNTLTNDVAEQNQKKNLSEQNKALLQKVITTLRMLKGLKSQVSRLEEKQTKVIEVSGNEPVQTEEPEPAPTIEYVKLKSDELLSHISNIEKRFTTFFSLPHDSLNVFDSLPVLTPIPEPAHISRRYGIAIDPFSGKKRRHNGTDFVAEAGTPVFATASGIVKRIEKNAIWGKKIVIKHGDGFSTVYAHLGEIKTAQGRRVKRGEVIGSIGLSGLSSGPHVHYEILRNDEPVNPEEYLFPNKLFASR